MKDVEFEEGNEKLNVMPIEEIIKKVSAACKNAERMDWLCLVLLQQEQQPPGVTLILWCMVT